MRNDDEDHQIEQLCAQARLHLGKQELQKAASLRPDDRQVHAILRQVHDHESSGQVLALCDRFFDQEDIEAAKKAILWVRKGPSSDASWLEPCLARLLTPCEQISEQWLSTYDDLLSSFILASSTSKKIVAQRIHAVDALLSAGHLGEQSATAVVAVVQTNEVWENENARRSAESRLFQICLRALDIATKRTTALVAVSRLISTDANSLNLDDSQFVQLFTLLDPKFGHKIKSLSTLILAWCIEKDQDRGIVLLQRFVLQHCARQTNDDFVTAFSAAAAMFPIVPVAVHLFLSDEFLVSLGTQLDPQFTNSYVLASAVDMMNAACIDSAARQALRKHCLSWLSKVDNKTAAVVLAKLQAEINTPSQSRDLVERLVQSMFQDPKANFGAATEGLAHATTQPWVKDLLVKDKRWLPVFLTELGSASHPSATLYGGLVILRNLTSYLPVQSEEQQRMAQLKAYANASRPIARHDPLDADDAVESRCIAVIASDASPVLFGKIRGRTPACLSLVLHILLSLSRSPRLHRQKLVQQGGIKTLVTIWHDLSDENVRKIAAQALARLLITTDPVVYFGPSGNPLLQSAIPILVSLLSQDETFVSEGPRDRLPSFESLLALTNLASAPTNGASETIVKFSVSTIDDLVLSTNEAIQRAAVELICNLVQHPTGISLFADASPPASRRLHVLLAMADVEDLRTRMAAGGALATLVQFDPVISAILQLDRGVDLFCAMLDDHDPEVLHRAAVCLVSALTAEGSACIMLRQELEERNTRKKVAKLAASCVNIEPRQLFLEATKLLD